MKTLKKLVGVLALSIPALASAQMSSLPENAAGDRVLPPVVVEIGVAGSYFWGTFFHDSIQEYIWGEVGAAIDDKLDDIGINITNEAGVLSYNVEIIFRNSLIYINGANLDKEVGESLEDAFERNYGQGDLENVDISGGLSDQEDPGLPGVESPGGLQTVDDPATTNLQELLNTFPPGAVLVLGEGGVGVVTCNPACF